MNLLSTITQGGPLMILIGICSVVAVAVAIERWSKLRPGRIIPEGFVDTVKRLLLKRRYSDAVSMCEDRYEVGVSVINAGLQRAGSSREIIRENFENAGRQANMKLSKGLGVLSTIASISPLLGLMGTVTGMIRVFQVISVQGVGDPGALSGGISEALITTAAGLAVGIPTLVVYNYFMKRTEIINLELESAASEILDLLDTDQSLDSGEE